MALEMFLKIDGVVGGTRNYQHKGWTDILSWNWALEHCAPDLASTAPCANMNQINVRKTTGPESPAILRLFAERAPIKLAEISAIPIVGKREKVNKYLSIVMQDVLVTSIRTDGEGEENYFRESIILQFGKIKFETYQNTPGDASGGEAKSENFEFAWDLDQNAEWVSA
jgi:type VI secretion system secreted protein Hcp